MSKSVMNSENEESQDNGFIFSTLPMQLQMFAMNLNKISMKLLMIRANRTKYTVETVQAIMDNNPEAINRQYGKMYSPNTLNEEWEQLEGIKAEIDTALAENMHLFEDADKALKKADNEGVNFVLLLLPEEKLKELKAKADNDNVYDFMGEYNDILNNFMHKLVEYCGELGMKLLKV